jgi:hypothetical protein
MQKTVFTEVTFEKVAFNIHSSPCERICPSFTICIYIYVGICVAHKHPKTHGLTALLSDIIIVHQADKFGYLE